MSSPQARIDAPHTEPLEWSATARRKIDWILTRYPTKQAALLPVLRVAEAEFHGIGPRAIRLVAAELDLSPGYVWGVFTFYTQFRREGEGKYLLQVCATLSCALRGCRDLVHRIEDKLGIAPGETTADGLFTLKKVECLGSCGTAPVVQVNDDYHEDLDVAKLDALIDKLRAEGGS